MSETPLTAAGRDAIEAARQEALRLNHDRLGSEHLLLGLLRQAHPAVLTALAERGLDPEQVRLAVEGGLKGGGRAVPPDMELQLRPRAQKVLDVATQAGGAEGAGPEHLLGALLAERGGPAARALGTGPRERVEEKPATGEEPVVPVQPPPEPPRESRPSGPASEEGRQPRKPREAGRQEKPRERQKEPAEERRPTPVEERRREARPERPARPRDAERQAARAAAAAEIESASRAARAQREEGRRIGAGGGGLGRGFGLLWRSALIICVPLSWYLNWAHASPTLVFVVACLGVLPLAGWMGEATEHLGARTGPTVGGLLNATFGNAAELIIAIAALRRGMVELVKASITGSILGNLLLILGLSLVAGGLNKPVFRFSRTAAGMSAGMLALAVIGLVFPALYHAAHPVAGAVNQLRLSEVVGGVLLLTYAASLLFSLKTHSRLMGGDPHPTTGKIWRTPMAILVLLAATAATAVQAEILVHAVGAVTAGTGISASFLGLIVVPLIGNAAEHAAAVLVARKGQVDLALQIALGSSTQVALLIAPLLVFIGLFMGQPMDLVFAPFEVIAVAVSTVVVSIITLDGESHWFEGIQLLAVYALVAAGAFFI